MRIEDLLTSKQIIDYTKANPPEVGALGNLFPTRKIADLEADYIMGAYNKEVMAQLYSFDTPTELGQTEAYERGTVSLYLMKEKMKFDEREIIRLHTPRTNAEQAEAIRRIYNYVDRINQRIENRIEWMRYQVVQTGKFEYDDNGIQVAIDFGVPKDHFGDFNWNDPTTDILMDIANTCDKIELDSGFRPEHILVSRKTLMNVVKNETIRSALLGTEAAKLITVPELNAELSRLGLPTFSIDSKTYGQEKIVKKNGKRVRQIENVRYLDEDKILFLPSGQLGETIRGVVPEQFIQGYTSASIEHYGETVITHYEETDPVAHYIKGSATAMVTFPYAEQIFIGTNKDK